MSQERPDRKSKSSGRQGLSSTTRKAPARRTRTLSPAGAKIVAAFEEAIDVMRSGGSGADKLTARTYRADFNVPDYGPADVQRVRGVLKMSQALFAGFLGVNANTIRSWEQGTRSPSAIARRFMAEIESAPNYWKQRINRVIETE